MNIFNFTYYLDYIYSYYMAISKYIILLKVKPLFYLNINYKIATNIILLNYIYIYIYIYLSIYMCMYTYMLQFELILCCIN